MVTSPNPADARSALPSGAWHLVTVYFADETALTLVISGETHFAISRMTDALSLHPAVAEVVSIWGDDGQIILTTTDGYRAARSRFVGDLGNRDTDTGPRLAETRERAARILDKGARHSLTLYVAGWETTYPLTVAGHSDDLFEVADALSMVEGIEKVVTCDERGRVTTLRDGFNPDLQPPPCDAGIWHQVRVYLRDGTARTVTVRATRDRPVCRMAWLLSRHGDVAEVVSVWGTDGRVIVHRDGRQVPTASHAPADAPGGARNHGNDEASRAGRLAAVTELIAPRRFEATRRLTVYPRHSTAYTVTVRGRTAGVLAHLAERMAQVADVARVVMLREDGSQAAYEGNPAAAARTR